MNPRPARTLCARCGIKLRAHTTRRTTCCQDCTKSDHTYARYLNRTDPTR